LYITEITASQSVTNGGGTGNEFPINLIKSGEEPWNKWCGPYSNYAYIQFIFMEKI
jgi:hypothetical protein